MAEDGGRCVDVDALKKSALCLSKETKECNLHLAVLSSTNEDRVRVVSDLDSLWRSHAVSRRFC